MSPDVSQSSHVVRVAVAQTAPRLGDNASNLEQVIEFAAEAAGGGAQLVVFPECALSGYLFDDIESCEAFAERIPGPATDRLQQFCAGAGIHVVLGVLEQGSEAMYNSAVLVGPDGMIGRYRKAHLPGLGLDRFVAHGNTPFAVYDTSLGRVGMAVCYDIRFPEPARIMALSGADILALPTNWPVVNHLAPPSTIPALITRTRAAENRMFLAVSDRVGREHGVDYLGRSQLIDVFGDVLTEADTHSETLLYADFDFALARQKDFIYAAGQFETHWFADRRPDLYGPLTDPDLWPQSARRAVEQRSVNVRAPAGTFAH
jgi:predicted amidohydrolase